MMDNSAFLLQESIRRSLTPQERSQLNPDALMQFAVRNTLTDSERAKLSSDQLMQLCSPTNHFIGRSYPIIARSIDAVCGSAHLGNIRTRKTVNLVKAMKKVALTRLKDDLSKYLRLAEKEQIVITRHGQPAGILVGFGSEDDWFDCQLENDPRVLNRIERARASLRSGQGVKLEDVTAAKKRRTKR